MYEVIIYMNSRSVVPIWCNVLVRDVQLGHRTKHICSYGRYINVRIQNLGGRRGIGDEE